MCPQGHPRDQGVDAVNAKAWLNPLIPGETGRELLSPAGIETGTLGGWSSVAAVPALGTRPK